MIVKNDAKGSYGAFSNMGRTTVNSFINIKRQDFILHPEKHLNGKQSIINFLKRNKYNNIEGDESKEQIKDDENFEEESENEEPIEEHDIFDLKEEEKEKKKKMRQKNRKRDPYSLYHKTNNEAYKYHDLHMTKKKIKKEFFTPNCTKYFPKKDFVWHKAPTCLNWDFMQKRKPLHYKIYEGKLLEHEDPLKNIKNCFVNMDKQTMRGDVIMHNNVRVQTARPFSKDKNGLHNIKRKTYRNKSRRIKTGIIREKDKKKIYHLTTDINSYNTTNLKQVTRELTEETNNNINNIQTTSDDKSKMFHEEQKNNFTTREIITKTEARDLDESSSDSIDSYHKYKPQYAKQLKINVKPELTEPQENINNEKQNYPIIKTETNESHILNMDNKRPKTALENKIIERKTKIKGPEFDKIIPREYYDNLHDNGITLIPFAVNNYKQVRERALTMVNYDTKKSFKKKLDFFKGLEIEQYLNIPINYIQHKNYVPMFNKMHTRPMDDGNPLPVFMKGVVSRNACDMTSNISLKMNYFAQGKTRGNYNTCLPKKSFNKVVNLNLMNYQELKKYMKMNKDLLLDGDNYIIKSIKFYNRNYRDLLKETTSNFDNITYKTIKSKYEYNLNT